MVQQRGKRPFVEIQDTDQIDFGQAMMLKAGLWNPYADRRKKDRERGS